MKYKKPNIHAYKGCIANYKFFKDIAKVNYLVIKEKYFDHSKTHFDSLYIAMVEDMIASNGYWLIA